MTEAPNWKALFEELPRAIAQLENHDAHHSLEAALCLKMALAVLRGVGSEDVYDRLMIGIGRLTEISMEGRGLSQPTEFFLEQVREAFHHWNEYDRDGDLVARLTQHPVPS